MKTNINYTKIILFLLMAVGIFSYFKLKSDKKGSPDPVIISTNTSVINDNGDYKIKAEAEIKNNGGDGYIVLEVKALYGNESWDKNINSYLKSNKTQNLQVIFDDKNIADKNPKFDFYVYPFKQ